MEIMTTVVLEKLNWDNCPIGTNGIGTTVVLGQMELGQLSYWDKWNWDNCPFVTTVIGTSVVASCYLPGL